MRLKQGFTLVEVTIVLLVVGLLISGVLVSATQLLRNSQVRQAESDLAQIKAALLGFALQHNRFPCPDTDGFTVVSSPDWGVAYDGVGNGSVAGCADPASGPVNNIRRGFLPATELGVNGLDPWRRPYIYFITQRYTESVVPLVPDQMIFSLNEPGALEIVDSTVIAGSSNQRVAEDVVWVVMSMGPGFNRADSSDGINVSEEENENINNITFVAQNFQPDNAQAITQPGGAPYDDLLDWQSHYVIKAQLLQAGKAFSP